MTIPDNAPLIIIDLQTDMFSGQSQPPIHEADALTARVQQALAWARARGRPVAFIRHDGPPDDTLAPGQPGWPVWPALGQAAHEPTFGKTVGDAFSNAALCDWVTAQGAAAVILAGAQTDFCVNASTRGALGLGLGVVLLSDAHSTWASEGESAEAIIARHNASFQALGVTVMPTGDLTAA